MSKAFKPHPYQERAIRHILSHGGCGLFLEMGLGKTVCVLTAIAQLEYFDFSVDKALIIAPLSVARSTWRQEAAKWDQTADLRISVCCGSAEERLAGLQADADVYVINRENVVWLADQYAGRRWPFDMIVIDESTSFKAASTERFKALKRILKTGSVRRMVLLTGTPMPQGYEDLWSQLFLIDGGKRLGRTMTEYRNRYLMPTAYAAGGRPVRYDVRKGCEQQIADAISDVCVTMRAKDYLTLPDRIVTDIDLQMPEEAMQVYRQMEREHLLRCAEGDVVALTAATLVSKLLQLSCGFAYTDREDPYVYDDTKLQALRDLIEQTKEPILVFYQFRSDHDRLLKEIPGAEDLNVEKWCKGKQRIALAHPASAGYGLNLQSGGHVIVWYGLTWSYEQYEQANARLHRQGQELPVRIYRLVCTGTADQLVIRALERKHEGSQWLIGQLLDKGKAPSEDGAV